MKNILRGKKLGKNIFFDYSSCKRNPIKFISVLSFCLLLIASITPIFSYTAVSNCAGFDYSFTTMACINPNSSGGCDSADAFFTGKTNDNRPAGYYAGIGFYGSSVITHQGHINICPGTYTIYQFSVFDNGISDRRYTYKGVAGQVTVNFTPTFFIGGKLHVTGNESLTAQATVTCGSYNLSAATVWTIEQDGTIFGTPITGSSISINIPATFGSSFKQGQFILKATVNLNSSLTGCSVEQSSYVFGSWYPQITYTYTSTPTFTSSQTPTFTQTFTPSNTFTPTQTSALEVIVNADKPVPGVLSTALVELYNVSPTPSPVNLYGYTDADGKKTFYTLPRGQYNVLVSKSCYIQEMSKINVIPGMNNYASILKVVPVHIFGTVKNTEGTPLKNAMVSYSGKNGNSTAKTDLDGNYNLYVDPVASAEDNGTLTADYKDKKKYRPEKHIIEGSSMGLCASVGNNFILRR